ncbi:creatininase family protein [Microlunatus sp. Gsoil 973]|uniref:creatininase family protein n=1 Tax=Microlunatus sp. Gsoil 973 TaxID=2672569 RepID=UPI001E5AB6AC|nr:creatininase family protein [Microlunatus sp. Gsoil 973]
MRTTRFDDLTREELARLAPGATVVVPIGSIEQHGPHLPVCADTEIITHVARSAVELAAETASVLVTPTLPFGLAQHHLPFGGTISFSSKVYLDLLTEIGTSLVNDGFQRILFLNGHGGNVSAAAMVADRLAYEYRLDAHIAAASYWECGADSLAKLDLDGAPAPGHAGSFETSCLLALRPELVHTDRIPPAEGELQPLAEQSAFTSTVRLPEVWQRSDGRTDDSHSASTELGHIALKMIIADVAEFIVRFHRT